VIEGPLKRIMFGALALSGALRLSEARIRGVTILAYHGVSAHHVGSLWSLRNRRRLHVPAALFEEHLDLLSSRWNPIQLSEYVAGVAESKRFPPRTVVLTFDDGYRNFLTTAHPLLLKYRVPAALFVVTHHAGRFWVDYLEAALESTEAHAVTWRGRSLPLSTPQQRQQVAAQLCRELQALASERAASQAEILEQLKAQQRPDDDRDLLSWDELRLLAQQGVEIGSHSKEHESLTLLEPPDVRLALSSSLSRLEEELGPGRYALSYPYGGHSVLIASLARDAGYCCGLTTDPGLNPRAPDLYALRRCLVGADDVPLRLRASLAGLRKLGRRRAE
jgi:peptidoglycan/xylan/chitin deacetylase (PgdA/CDA1 family)